MSDSELTLEPLDNPAGEAAPAPEPALPAGAVPPRENLPPAGGPLSPSDFLQPRFLLDAFLIALIVIGVYFRFSWTNWSQGTDLHPDEYGLTAHLTQISIPKSVDQWFNTRLSPMSFYDKYDETGQRTQGGPDNRMRWGQWPLIIIRWVAEQSGNTGYTELRLMGRQLSALFDVGSLFMIFLIGWRLYNRRIGLIAAALSALAVMQIQQSHFMTTDHFAAFFTACAMYCAIRIPGRGVQLNAPTGRGWQWYALFGLVSGMALASRINLVPLLGMIVVAAFIVYFERLQKDDLLKVFTDAGLRVGLALVVAALTFRITQPATFRAETGDTGFFTLTPNPDWADSMAVAQAESSGQGGGPPGEQWTNRTVLVFPFVNMVLWGMGLPLGLAAWAGLAWAAWRSLKAKEEWQKHLLPLVWAGGYFLFMGTRWVKSIRYFLPIYPFMALFAAWALYELWQKSEVRSQKSDGRSTQFPTSDFRSLISNSHLLPALAFLIVTLGTLAWAYGFTSIYRHDNTRIQASRWMYANIPGPFNLHFETDTGQYTEPIPFPPGLPISEAPYRMQFMAHASGALSGLTLGHATPAGGAPAAMRLVLAADPDGKNVLAQGAVLVSPSTTDPRGDTLSVAFGPTTVISGVTYYLFASTDPGVAISVVGSTVSNENWDEGLPLRLDGRDAFGGLYTGVTMEMQWFDNEDKRQMLLANLATVDYIILPSQRRIWASTRLPNTYPMTMEFYRALFDGRLGFELAAQFQSPIVIGPLQVSDLVGTAAWGRAPEIPNPNDFFNYSQLAAEEAFSVYDHAPVWIFRKRADFDLGAAQAFLKSFDLSTVINQGPRDATKAPPSRLMLPADLLAAQRAGGTWSEMFDAASLLNTSQPLGVFAWWALLLVMGWIAFPLTWVVFGGLADGGYPLARTVALLVVAWFAWFLASYQVLPYTRGTLALGLALLALASALLAYLRRAELRNYLIANYRHLLIVEGVFLALFLFDLAIRYGNPDLWHPYFGGEKPMDFSYFNAVLKSTYFPPYDPWLAGGYINYYYYGYVIVGVPLKLLGITPAFGYNLILPSLFAMLGINAFCVAYNLVKANPKPQTPNPNSAPIIPEAQSLIIDDQSPITNQQSPISNPSLTPAHPHTASPYFAGIAAALLIVVLGNLGQVKYLAKGFQRAADRAALAESLLGDNDFTATVNGAGRVFTGQSEIPIGLGSWYWDATRIISAEENERSKAAGEGDQNGNEIAEFPFFTFLYADLHAHMIDLPFTVLALAWAVAYFVSIQRKRAWYESAALWVVGGLALGVTRPTNTWDYYVYLALAAVAIFAAHWAKDEFRFSRALFIDAGWRLVVLVGLATIFYRPYDQWFASGYTEFELWKGPKTPLNAYLYVYGLFLFLVVSFLIVETRRWLAETPATILADADEWLPALVFALLAFAAAVGVFLYLGAETAIVSIPVMTWAGLLLLRANANMPLEKRVALFCIGTGMFITLFVEIVVLKGDIGRQNTIFKFYLQVWTLLSIAGGAAVAWVWDSLRDWKPAWQNGWLVGLMTLTAGAALYTVTAANAKIQDRFPARVAVESTDPGADCKILPGMPLPENFVNHQSLPIEDQPHTLDGMAYLQWSAYCDKSYILPLAYDYEAMRWMQDNVIGSPVIVEAQTFDLYRLSSRYAWNTGLPNVVGWDWHQRQQRAALATDFIQMRGIETSAFYQTISDAEAMDFLKKYEVRYIVVGPMERAYYPPEGIAKFTSMAAAGKIQLAYENPGVKIYEVPVDVAGQ